MSENDNKFELVVKRLYVKFGKLQIDGIHGKGGFRVHKSSSPFLRNEGASSGFSVHKSVN